MIACFVFWIFVGATVVQLAFWIFLYGKLARYQLPKEEHSHHSEENHQPVSILICAHNEYDNLKANLPRILNQNYRSFEVLVINHNSTDRSEKLLTSLQKNYSNLRFINFSNTKKGKKLALAKGIEEAKHNVLLLTDADCHPKSNNWLRQMQSVIQNQIEIGLGFGPYEIETGILNKLIRYETNLTATQYFSFALAGIPFMGVGRNLIYKRELYQKADGFKKHHDLLSGDDDLFINAVAHAGNTQIILHPDTFMYSPPKRTWRSWYQQKSRHLTTGKKYQLHHQLLLGLASMSHVLHYVAGILVAWQIGIAFCLLFYLLRLFTMLLIYKAILKKLHDAILITWLPLLDAAFVLYYVFFSPIIFFGRKNSDW